MKFYGVKLLFDPNGVISTPLDSITFPMDGTISSAPFVIKSIDGLDPPDINVLIGDSLIAGGVYQGRRPQPRQIVMTIKYQPSYATGQTVSDLRSQLYAFIDTKIEIPLKFALVSNAYNILYWTLGYISKFEANPFTNDPQAIITIDCLDPYLIAGSQTLATSATSSPISLTNPGTASVGFTMRFTFGSSSASLEFYNGLSTNKMQFVYPFLSGDIVDISTVTGSITATVTRSSVTTNLLNYVQTSTRWLQLHTGVNMLYISAPASSWTVNYIIITPRYWGV